MYDTTTEYDSDDEVTVDSNTGQTQPLAAAAAAAAAAQQQVNLDIAATVLSHVLCISSRKLIWQCTWSANSLLSGIICPGTHVQDDAAVGGRVEEGSYDESDDSDYTAEALEDIISDGELDDVEEQNTDELLDELREEPGTINSPTRS